MSLSESCRDYIGYTLYVTTHYGWGWSGSQINSLEVLEKFELSLESLWSWRGELRGGIGKVVTEGHKAQGWWVTFATRHSRIYDFDSVVGLYNLSLGGAKPETKCDGRPQFEEHYCGGYGEVRAHFYGR